MRQMASTMMAPTQSTPRGPRVSVFPATLSLMTSLSFDMHITCRRRVFGGVSLKPSSNASPTGRSRPRSSLRRSTPQRAAHHAVVRRGRSHRVQRRNGVVAQRAILHHQRGARGFSGALKQYVMADAQTHDDVQIAARLVEQLSLIQRIARYRPRKSQQLSSMPNSDRRIAPTCRRFRTPESRWHARPSRARAPRR